MCIRIIQTWFIFIIGIFTLQAQGADDQILSKIDAVGFNFITDVHYLDDGSFYCILKHSFGTTKPKINGLEVETPSVPEEFQFGYDGFSFLIKVNEDFEIDKQIYFGGIAFDVIYLEEEIVLKNNWERDGSIIVNDSLVNISSNHRTRIYRYDYDLNYLGDRKFENLVSHIAQGSKDILYIAVTLDEVDSHFVNAGDSLENFYYISNSSGSKIYGDQATILLTYDIQKDSIMTARKFGSLAKTPIHDFLVEDEGHLIVSGSIDGSGAWISLDGIDTLDTYTAPENTGNEFIIKFNLDGDFIYGRILPLSGVNNVKLGNDDIYLTGRYYGSSKVIDGIELSSPEVAGLNQQSCMIKLDGDTGIAEWAIEMEGAVRQESFSDLDVKDDTIMVSHTAFIGSIWIDGVEYLAPPDAPPGSAQEKLVSYLWVDANSGELFDYRVFSILIKGLFTINIKQLGNGKYDMFLNMEGENIVFDEELGSVDNGSRTNSLNFLRISKQGSLVPVLDDIYGSLYNIYPNPTTDRIYVDQKLKEELYSVYDLSGQLIKTGKVTEEGISTSALSSGTYMLSVLGERSQLFVKE